MKVAIKDHNILRVPIKKSDDPEFVSQAIDPSQGRFLRISRFEREGRDFDSIVSLLKKHRDIDEKLLQQRQRGGTHSEARKAFAYIAAKMYQAPVSEIADYLHVGVSAVSALSRAGCGIVMKWDVVM